MSDNVFASSDSGNNAEANLMGNDNPLAVFDSPTNCDGGANDHGAKSNPGAKLVGNDNPLAMIDSLPHNSKPGADDDLNDLLCDGPLPGADSPAPAEGEESSEEEELFEPLGSKLKAYDHDNIDSARDGVSSGEEESHLDTTGWSQRLIDPDGADVREHAAPDYGVDHNTARMDVNVKGGQNNSRRGLFGRWRSRRYRDDPKAPEVGNGGPGWTKLSRDEVEEAGEGGDEELDDAQNTDNKLRPGDHIYVWQTYGINPRAYQRHAVVFSVTRVGAADPRTLPPPQAPSSPGEAEEQPTFDLGTLHTENEDNVEVVVVSFYHLNRGNPASEALLTASTKSGRPNKRFGCKKDFLIDFIGPDGVTKKKPVHKVKYGRKVKKGLLSQKAGVGTALKKDQVGLIMARVQYLLDHPDQMPVHNALSANGECASLWAVTGRWCTLQGASILAITGAGQAGGALVAGGILSNLTLLVPMPGLWGAAGWWWYVPATVAYPFLVPMLVALGMASLVPLEILRRNRKKWRAITDELNHKFWSAASEGFKEEYFGVMAAADREAEVRGFFGVREDETAGEAADTRYMPLGSAAGGMESDEDEDEGMAMQQMENSCQKIAGDLNVDLSGRPPSANASPRQSSGAWGKVMGSFRKNQNQNSKEDEAETKQFHTTAEFHDTRA